MGLIQSLLPHKRYYGFDIGFLDVGLSDANREKLSTLNVLVKKAGIDIDYKGRMAWEQQRPFIRAMTSRPFLPHYFPGYETYAWMDADTWLQTYDMLENVFASVAKDQMLYIAAEFDRDYKHLFQSAALWQVHFNWYKAIFPLEIANQMSLRPMMNDGVFFMSGQSPVWAVWRKVFADLLQNADAITPNYFMADQLSLNVAVYLNQLPVHMLPAEYNWNALLCLPSYNAEKQVFVRPSLPHTPLSVVHLTGETKGSSQKIRTLDKREIVMSLAYAPNGLLGVNS